MDFSISYLYISMKVSSEWKSTRLSLTSEWWVLELQGCVRYPLPPTPSFIHSCKNLTNKYMIRVSDDAMIHRLWCEHQSLSEEHNFILNIQKLDNIGRKSLPMQLYSGKHSLLWDIIISDDRDFWLCSYFTFQIVVFVFVLDVASGFLMFFHLTVTLTFDIFPPRSNQLLQCNDSLLSVTMGSSCWIGLVISSVCVHVLEQAPRSVWIDSVCSCAEQKLNVSSAMAIQ